MKKNIIFVVSIILLLFLFTVFGCGECKHEWQPATCIEPKICKLCGETEGTPRGHIWDYATCTMTCKKCGKTEDRFYGHEWQPATCTTPKTCKLCGKIEGTILGHDWQSATCMTPKTCKTCGMTEGNTVEHLYIDGICKYCKKEAIGKFICDLPSSCSYLGNTQCIVKQCTFEYMSNGWLWVEILATKTYDKAGYDKNAVGFKMQIWDADGSNLLLEKKFSTNKASVGSDFIITYTFTTEELNEAKIWKANNYKVHFYGVYSF